MSEEEDKSGVDEFYRCQIRSLWEKLNLHEKGCADYRDQTNKSIHTLIGGISVVKYLLTALGGGGLVIYLLEKLT